jgi:hypothetical protein
MQAGRVGLAMVVGFGALLLAFAALSGWQGATRLAGRGSQAHAVEAVTREFVEAYGTFDFHEPAAYEQRLVPLTSGNVRAALAGAGVDPVAVGQQRQLTTTVLSVRVTTLAKDEATTEATAEQLRRGVDPASGQPTEERVQQEVACRLVHQGSRWLVADFRLLGEEPLSVAPAAGSGASQ